MVMQALPVLKEYNGQRVVTLQDIDMLHQRKEGNAWKNFNNNRRHFLEGEDYFHVRQEEIQNGKYFGFEIGKRGTYLFTQTGYLMIVKSFTDDLSWAIQRELVNGYFSGRKLGKTFLGVPVMTVKEYCQGTGEDVSTVRSRLKARYAAFPLGSVLHLEGFNLRVYKAENPEEGKTARALWILTRQGAELLHGMRHARQGLPAGPALTVGRTE